MADYVIEILFEGLNMDDPEEIGALADVDVVTAESIDSDLTRLAAVVAHDDAVSAASSFVEMVLQAVPTAVPIAVDRDLVSVTDIADRVGVTREAVRNWSNGKRRASRFPAHVGVPSGSKVWEWSAIHSWLREELGVWDELEMPSHEEYAAIERWLHYRTRIQERVLLDRMLLWAVVEAQSATVDVKKPTRSRASSSLSWSRNAERIKSVELVA